ncbi:hypothetical protein BO82DRAFT_203653 [Aspergillus uvarum CBS 121591]|uniref:Uncharacterized protein n=1 Tax=Aspergillus uvarum CBS 121591 TaxID=1448315 RepID=A0A319BWB8_9EURO|nr:hypothetical protein BO82DRAFT_203653 [Aspergillus uvarum CBS 121591]PYH76517.1 hypothetical protein BO82DRAFT_203653 [Aspergillus uvarum CBS 121591]
MSAPGGAPSPAPRSGSMGPGPGGMSMPPQQPMTNTGPVTPGPPAPPPPPPGGPMSQQNLNQIVCIRLSFLVRCALCRGRWFLRRWGCCAGSGMLLCIHIADVAVKVP